MRTLWKTLRPVVFVTALAWLGLSAAAGELRAFPGAVLVPDPDNDGDSFRVNLGERTAVLRLYFVDCPETGAESDSDARRVREQTRYFGLPGAEKTVAFGRRARALTAEALGEPFTVYTSFASAPGRSKGGRCYAFVVTARGRDLASLLVENGLARSYGLGRGTPGGLGREEAKLRLSDREAAAMIKRVGIWAESDPDRIVELRAEQRREEAELAVIRESAGQRMPSGRIDINRATVRELQLLHGIGPALARRIVEARPFRSVDDLTRVDGIGPKTLDRLRDHVTVSQTPE